MTPRGDSITIPQNSTVLDFAYRIHTEIGHKTVGAKVDGKMVPLDYRLKTGEICEILTSKDPNKGPTRAWQQIVQTNEAKAKIRSWFKKEKREENIQHGMSSLEQEFKRFRINLPPDELVNFLADDLKRHNCDNLEDFYASIGYGGVSLSKIMPRLKDKYEKNYGKSLESESEEMPIIEPVSKNSDGCIEIDKIDDIVYKLAKCCSPMPGDDIVGFITRGHGISIHAKSCINYTSAVKRNIPEEMERWMAVKWKDTAKPLKLDIGLEIVAVDRVGLVFDVSKILMENHVMIMNSNSRTLKNGNAIIEVTVRVDGTDQLKNVMEKLKKIKSVISVERARK